MAKSKYFKIITYGCEMNDYDSEVISSILTDNGYVVADNIKDADTIIVNGCSVREHAHKRALGFIKSLNSTKKRIIITGCLAKALEDDISLSKESLIVSTEYKKLPELIKKERFKEVKIESDGNYSAYLRRSGFTLYVPVMKGCNNFCSYCIVPYLRGEEISFSVEDILKNIKNNIGEKTREIMLLGQNVNSYLYGETNFVKLLEKVAINNKNLRIRFLTSHPKDFSPSLVELMKDYENICPHIHLPVQTGSDKLLKIMQRGYTIYNYLKNVESIRNIMGDITITTDLMIGIPYEEEKDFRDTLKLLNSVQFDDAFLYKFSKRDKTLAYYMKTPDGEISSSRLKELIETQRKIKEKKLKQLINKKLEVIVEKVSKKNENEFYGRDRQNRSVIVSGKISSIGEVVKIKVVEIKGITPYGIKEENL